jgi:hypothetical protein
MTQDFFPSLSDAILERRATQELIETAQALIAHGAPTVSPEAFHDWLDAPEEFALFPTDADHTSEDFSKT